MYLIRHYKFSQQGAITKRMTVVGEMEGMGVLANPKRKTILSCKLTWCFVAQKSRLSFEQE